MHSRRFRYFILTLLISLYETVAFAQCSICTKTAAQMGKASGEGLNSGIVYLMLTPFAIAGYIGYRWWKQEKQTRNEAL